jgi:type I restriction enzyme S subunit
LGDVTDFVLDGTHGSPIRTEVGIPVLSAQNVVEGRLNYGTDRYTSADEYSAFAKRVAIRPGDLLLTIVGTIGRAAIVDDVWPAVFQRSVSIIRPSKDRLDPRYIFHVTQSAQFKRQLASATNGSTQGGVYLGKLKEVLLPLPPLNEQRRIAAILDQADSLRRKRLAALRQTEALRKSIFESMFGGEPALSGWPAKELADVVRAGTIITYGMVQAGEEFEGGVPYIRTGDIVGGEILVDQLRRADPAIAARFDRARVAAGDIVMSIRATVGTTAMVPTALDGANLTQGTAKIAPGVTTDPLYLLDCLRSGPSQDWISKQVKGATFREITLGRLREMPITIPPLDLQKRYSKRVQCLVKMQAIQKAQLGQLEALFASLQHRAFAGEL